LRSKPLTLHPGATLTITFTVRNGAATARNYTAPYAGAAPGPTATTLQAGPCGSVGFEIFGPHHTNVWPGVQVVNCPVLGFAQLPANGTVSGSGSWNQAKPNSTARVRAGNHTLVVENRHFSFPAPRPGALRPGLGARLGVPVPGSGPVWRVRTRDARVGSGGVAPFVYTEPSVIPRR